MNIGIHRDKQGRIWELRVNALGQKHEWHAIVSTNVDGPNTVLAVGQPKYVAGKWKELKGR